VTMLPYTGGGYGGFSFTGGLGYGSAADAGLAVLPPKVPPEKDARGGSRARANRIAERVVQLTLAGSMRWPRWVDPNTKDPWACFDAYEEMARDPQAWGALRSVVLAVAALDVQVTPSEDPEAPDEQELAKFTRKSIDLAGGILPLTWQIAAPAVMRGLSITEPNFALRPLSSGQFAGKIPWREWSSIDTAFVRPRLNEYRRIVGIEAPVMKAGKQERALLNPDDFVIYSYLSLFEDPGGRSAFAVGYQDWWRKVVMLQLWAVILETWGAPGLSATGPGMPNPVSNPVEYEQIRDALENFKAFRYIAAPPNVVIEAVTSAANGAPDCEKFVARCDASVLIAISGSHLPIQEGIKANVAGNSNVQKSVNELIQWALAADVGRHITKAAVPLGRLNYAGVPSSKITLSSVDEAYVTSVLTNGKTLHDMGVPLSKKQVYARSAWEPPADDDDTIGGPQPQVVGPDGLPLPGGNGKANPFGGPPALNGATKRPALPAGKG
jgi:hypothetical protein